MPTQLSIQGFSSITLPQPNGWVGHLDGQPNVPDNGPGQPSAGVTFNVTVPANSPACAFLTAHAGQTLGAGTFLTSDGSGGTSTLNFTSCAVARATGHGNPPESFVITLWPAPLSP